VNQLTLRQIPEEVDRELRQQASRNGTSLNQTVIVVLRQGLGLAPFAKRRRDLSSLGSWTAEEVDEFDRNTQIFRQIDDELWK